MDIKEIINRPSDMPAVMKIKVRKTDKGKFVVTREDGRVYEVRKVYMDPIRKKNIRWIIESMDNFGMTDEKTFAGVKYNISQGWTKGVTREVGVQPTPEWWKHFADENKNE